MFTSGPANLLHAKASLAFHYNYLADETLDSFQPFGRLEYQMEV